MEMKERRENKSKKNMMKREMGLSYDISSWSETERRNEMLLKAAFIWIV